MTMTKGGPRWATARTDPDYGKRAGSFGKSSGDLKLLHSKRPSPRFSLREAELRTAEREVFQCRVLLDSLIARRDALAALVARE